MILLPLLVATSVCLVQPDLPTYSIRPSARPGANAGAVVVGTDGNTHKTISYERTYPLQLVMRAFGIQIDQISGPASLFDPPSTKNEPLYDIDVDIPTGIDDPKYSERDLILRMLTERFGFRFHHESRSFPAYDLVVADGGPKMTVSNPLPDAHGLVGSIRGRQALLGKRGTIQIEGRAPMRELARHLAYDINESNGVRLGGVTPRVTDRTGLPGVYEFTLAFRGRVSLPSTAQAPDEVPTSGPSLFEALERQLGLRLRRVADVTLDCIAIDNLDPTQ